MKTHTHTRSINKEKQQQIQQYIPMHTKKKKNLKEKQHKKYTHIPPLPLLRQQPDQDSCRTNT